MKKFNRLAGVLLLGAVFLQACQTEGAPMPTASAKTRVPPAGAKLPPVTLPLSGNLPPAPPGCEVSGNVEIENRVIELVDVERAKQNLPALKAQPQLIASARIHTVDMACRNAISHTGSDDSTDAMRVERMAYQWIALRENVAAGLATPEQVVRAWMNSPGHRANLLANNVKEMGVGYVLNGSTESKHFWTLILGASQE